MNTALIISLNFHPGHVSHMVASYKQMEELGYESVYYVAENFLAYLPADSRVCVYGKDTLPKVEIALFLFPSQKNLLLIRKLKRLRSKILYIFHEPLAPLEEYKRAGFSYKYLAKLWVINRISALTVKWSDAVLLPSQKAVEFYNANHLYKNDNHQYIPLMYDDERTDVLSSMSRKYVSYIGTIAADHSFLEFVRFVECAIAADWMPEVHFLIATKSEFDIPDMLASSPRVTIYKGKPMSDDQINGYYATTHVVWNAYARTTQSGVLAKSFMFGTPAIVLKKNLSEFTKDGCEVVAIDDNGSFHEISSAIERIILDFNHFSAEARKRFENTFYYRKYNERLDKILASL